ncbi:MAG: hypothetical protein O7H39_04120 [Gammaproteobacteria bacterium]|nr:hypothetical protein [Gammaproteobacteria bacterium]
MTVPKLHGKPFLIPVDITSGRFEAAEDNIKQLGESVRDDINKHFEIWFKVASHP